VLRTLGAALVHAVRGFDGEGAVVLHRALAVARSVGSEPLTADILRELAFVDLQAGRHASATRALREASAHADVVGDPVLTAAVLAITGMNEADQGQHDRAVKLLRSSAQLAATAGSIRQEAWSLGILARSLLLGGDLGAARAAAERSMEICDRERWNAFRPWPQALRAHCLAAAGDTRDARDDAEDAYALACELGDPCWEGMAGRALALLALHAGNGGGPATGSSTRAADVTGCRIAMSGCRASSASGSWRSPPGTNPIWCDPSRPGCTPTRCGWTCRSSSPGRWSIRPRRGNGRT
jgi:hypothetical protein